MADRIVQINLGLLVKNKHVDAVIIIFPTVLNILLHFGLTFALENNSGHWHFSIC